MLGSTNRTRDISNNLKNFKTTDDYASLRVQDRSSKISINAKQAFNTTNSQDQGSVKHSKSRSLRTKSILGLKYPDMALELKNGDLKKQIDKMSKKGGVFNYETARKKIYEAGTFLCHK